MEEAQLHSPWHTFMAAISKTIQNQGSKVDFTALVQRAHEELLPTLDAQKDKKKHAGYTAESLLAVENAYKEQQLHLRGRRIEHINYYLWLIGRSYVRLVDNEHPSFPFVTQLMDQLIELLAHEDNVVVLFETAQYCMEFKLVEQLNAIIALCQKCTMANDLESLADFIKLCVDANKAEVIDALLSAGSTLTLLQWLTIYEYLRTNQGCYAYIFTHWTTVLSTEDVFYILSNLDYPLTEQELKTLDKCSRDTFQLMKEPMFSCLVHHCSEPAYTAYLQLYSQCEMGRAEFQAVLQHPEQATLIQSQLVAFVLSDQGDSDLAFLLLSNMSIAAQDLKNILAHYFLDGKNRFNGKFWQCCSLLNTQLQQNCDEEKYKALSQLLVFFKENDIVEREEYSDLICTFIKLIRENDQHSKQLPGLKAIILHRCTALIDRLLSEKYLSSLSEIVIYLMTVDSGRYRDFIRITVKKNDDCFNGIVRALAIHHDNTHALFALHIVLSCRKSFDDCISSMFQFEVGDDETKHQVYQRVSSFLAFYEKFPRRYELVKEKVISLFSHLLPTMLFSDRLLATPRNRVRSALVHQLSVNIDHADAMLACYANSNLPNASGQINDLYSALPKKDKPLVADKLRPLLSTVPFNLRVQLPVFTMADSMEACCREMLTTNFLSTANSSRASVVSILTDINESKQIAVDQLLKNFSIMRNADLAELMEQLGLDVEHQACLMLLIAKFGQYHNLLESMQKLLVNNATLKKKVLSIIMLPNTSIASSISHAYLEYCFKLNIYTEHELQQWGFYSKFTSSPVLPIFGTVHKLIQTIMRPYPTDKSDKALYQFIPKSPFALLLTSKIIEHLYSSYMKSIASNDDTGIVSFVAYLQSLVPKWHFNHFMAFIYYHCPQNLNKAANLTLKSMPAAKAIAIVDMLKAYVDLESMSDDIEMIECQASLGMTIYLPEKLQTQLLKCDQLLQQAKTKLQQLGYVFSSTQEYCIYRNGDQVAMKLDKEQTQALLMIYSSAEIDSLRMENS